MLGVDHPSQTGSHTRTRIWDLAHDKGFQNFCKILNFSDLSQVPCSAASSPNCAPDWSLHPRFPWFRSGALVYQIDSLRRSSIVNRKSGYLILKVGTDDTHAFAVLAFWDVLMIIYISQSQRLYHRPCSHRLWFFGSAPPRGSQHPRSVRPIHTAAVLQKEITKKCHDDRGGQI